MPTLRQIEAIFDNLSQGNAAEFYKHVDDNVAWTVKGTFCAIAGEYNSKAAFFTGIKSLSSTWATPLKLVVQDIIFDGDKRAAVEMKAVDVICKNGLAFNNEYVWVCHFNKENRIVKINAFMDTDLVTRAIEQNSD
ncbi:hypothetical protein C7974DRAFT_338325 [Boeremia exigua]|uniref:uncharacterized protein n=1 Tax=Boeremia exigua TaxID=749465 RepID=UPI001E8DFC10|nr:uncharacterized protein C7974DRAFT_338325 [Boeremia exigua]KAH6625934.1 hypothetical protein C7974DRAFT_338325 [Boeremia exigua]